MDWRTRITIDPNILTGKPTVRGTRLAVGMLLELLANGWTEKQIRDSYPQLSRDDLLAVFAYSAARIKDEEFIPLKDGTKG